MNRRFPDNTEKFRSHGKYRNNIPIFIFEPYSVIIRERNPKMYHDGYPVLSEGAIAWVSSGPSGVSFVPNRGFLSGKKKIRTHPSFSADSSFQGRSDGTSLPGP